MAEQQLKLWLTWGATGVKELGAESTPRYSSITELTPVVTRLLLHEAAAAMLTKDWAPKGVVWLTPL